MNTSVFARLFIAVMLLACQGVEDEAIGGPKKYTGSQPLVVNIESLPRHKISPYIYGYGHYLEKDRTAENQWQSRPTLYRFGGNTSDRYNWKLDTFNSGKDWFFTNFKSQATGGIDAFMADNATRGVASSITLPLLGWVAKDSTSMSYPTSVFPNQKGQNNGAGNGIGADGKELKTDATRTSMSTSHEFIAEWVRHLKTKFGNGPHFYIIGNEPMLWHETHRDVQSSPLTYDEYLRKYLAAAIAVRQADPAAVIIGPALWGWLDVQYSAFDMKGPWNNNTFGADRKKHGDVPFLEWFLREVVKKEKELGMSLIDIVDAHYYPQDEAIYASDVTKPENRRIRIQSTRSLWDRTYKDQSWIKENVYFIPRLQSMIAKVKPSLKLSIGEYNWRGENDFSGVIAQAEVLGIFAAQNLYMAQYWTDPPRGSLVTQAFMLFRNYDGQGGSFGDTYLNNSMGTKESGSVYTAIDETKKRVTAVVINKDLGNAQTYELKLAPQHGRPKSVTVYTFNQKTPQFIKRDMVAASATVRIAAEPLSIQLIEWQL